MSAEFSSFRTASRRPATFVSFPRDAAGHKSSSKTGLPRNKKGFTLLEALIAGTIFAMMATGIYAMLFKSYQLAALCRYRDDARAVLQTFADQFERLDISDFIYTNSSNTVITFPSADIYQTSTKNVIDASGNIVYSNITKTGDPRELFTLTSGTGNGLRYWDTTNQEILPSNVKSSDPTVLNWNGTTALQFTLGANTGTGTTSTDAKAITAWATRKVVQINNTSGAINTTPLTSNPPAGQLLEATFTITYSVYGRSVTQTLSVMRLAE
ncbi:MAG TPA: prepilin-type N-terminal cleavage/methylation domain-containing protein [Opitutaceae bacterium]|jgi:Tfp pilus assembly protein PilV|nr:prepilin-type N-terminal cleavage/methylation domain-containing protein [Opitutaceae bacterium]